MTVIYLWIWYLQYICCPHLCPEKKFFTVIFGSFSLLLFFQCSRQTWTWKKKQKKKNRPNRTLMSNKPNFVQNRMHFCPAEKKKINEVSGKRHYLGGRSLRLQSKPLHRYDFNILYMQMSSHRHWHGHWPVHSAAQPTGQHFCKDNLEYLTIKDQIFESET